MSPWINGASFTFWVCLAGLAAAYPGKLLLSLLARRVRPPWRIDETHAPTFTIVVIARNAERVIHDTLESCLTLDYPFDKVDVVVVSDQSEDATDAIVAEYAGRCVTLLQFGEHIGKTRILNRVLPLVRGEIVLVTDADMLLEPDVLRCCGRWFADHRVGFISGDARRADSKSGQFLAGNLCRVVDVIGLSAASRVGAALSDCSGPYCLRTSLWRSLPDNALSNDGLATALNVLRQGLVVIHDNQARSIKHINADPEQEFSHRVRIGAGDYQCFGWNLWLLNPLCGWKSLIFWVHKVPRWFTPHMMMGALAAHLLLVTNGRLIWLLVPHLAFYAVGMVGLVLNRHGHSGGGLVSALGHFVLINVAVGVGFLRYLRGIQASTWNPTRH